MKLKIALSVLGTLMVGSIASAHSDYWRCAVSAGSADRVAQLCGNRSDYDRTGRVGPAPGRGGWDRGGYDRGGYDRGGWDRGGRPGYGPGYGRPGRRWSQTLDLGITAAPTVTCFSNAQCQGEAVEQVNVQTCVTMEGASFADAAGTCSTF